jgi:hypothetical protein
MDPDPVLGGLKTYGSYGSGTLVKGYVQITGYRYREGH